MYSQVKQIFIKWNLLGNLLYDEKDTKRQPETHATKSNAENNPEDSDMAIMELLFPQFFLLYPSS